MDCVCRTPSSAHGTRHSWIVVKTPEHLVEETGGCPVWTSFAGSKVPTPGGGGVPQTRPARWPAASTHAGEVRCRPQHAPAAGVVDSSAPGASACEAPRTASERKAKRMRLGQGTLHARGRRVRRRTCGWGRKDSRACPAITRGRAVYPSRARPLSAGLDRNGSARTEKPSGDNSLPRVTGEPSCDPFVSAVARVPTERKHANRRSVHDERDGRSAHPCGTRHPMCATTSAPSDAVA
jgi:hypothetical protein